MMTQSSWKKVAFCNGAVEGPASLICTSCPDPWRLGPVIVGCGARKSSCMALIGRFGTSCNARCWRESGRSYAISSGGGENDHTLRHDALGPYPVILRDGLEGKTIKKEQGSSLPP